ncbi:hypothetical protein NE236_03580 [Actinoallomurus purpureus]|uniref:hypothetical protein n=1 Tax=Actinoallomurus purpureus TaxID=478114 RepID=UPI002093E957|nr:hypothetical protein [Actinoallomurus purpureus]MCO6004050.1 hypothetical protein [Actinoallomurus purpureus]
MDLGWDAVRNRLQRAGNSWSGIVGLGWEATVNDYGVAVAMPQGQSRVPNPSTEQQ